MTARGLEMRNNSLHKAHMDQLMATSLRLLYSYLNDKTNRDLSLCLQAEHLKLVRFHLMRGI